jgi:hypothetical protein
MPFYSRYLAQLACVTAIGCASTATQVPIPTHHLSAQRERSVARDETRAEGVLERQAVLEDEPIQCGPLIAGQSGDICWTALKESGAAAEDLMKAAELRDAAARHRLISKELRDAEARACGGIAEADVVRSPFAHRTDIVDVEVVHGAAEAGRPPPVLGARVRFHHVGGLTAERLQHLVDCHIARNDALGNDVPEMSFDPLVPPGARATVIEIPHGYIVDVRSDDPVAAREIARRALALLE